MSTASDDSSDTSIPNPLDSGVTPDRDNPYGGFNADWWHDDAQRYRAMARCAYWTFVPHEHNNATRKIVTSILMGTWAIITVGIAFGAAESGQYYPYISTLVFAIVCTIWGFEMGMLDAVVSKNDEE